MSKKNVWVGTVILESRKQFRKTDNKERITALLEIVQETANRETGPGILVFPCGYFHTGKLKANPRNYNRWVNAIKSKLGTINNEEVVVCFGIDGGTGKTSAIGPHEDQIALAVDKRGIIAMGRKFYPTSGEMKTTRLAPDYLSQENGTPRIFSLNGKKFYLAVCYDIFGIKYDSLPNPGVNGILNFIHKFTPRCQCQENTCTCEPASGDVYFVKNGLVGASRQWNCPVWGSVVFFNRPIPPKWPAGVFWNQNGKHLRYWKYSDNPIQIQSEFECFIPEGRAAVKVYNVKKNGGSKGFN